jgi:hypothetical protein
LDTLFDVHRGIFERKMYMRSFDLLVYATLLVDDVDRDFVPGMMESYDEFVEIVLVVVLIVVDVVEDDN